MSIFKQKRESPRKSLIYYLETSERDSGGLIGRIVDITTGGFQLIGEEVSEMGKTYRLNIQLPENIQGLTALSVDCRCVRSVKDQHSRYFYSGFQFREIDATNVSIIEKLIAQYEF